VDPRDPRIDALARRMSGMSDETWQQQQDFIKFLNLPGIRHLASGLGVKLDDLMSQRQEVAEGTAAMLMAATLFGPFGWTITTRQLKQTDHIEAVRLWERTHDDAIVDDFLTRAWAHGDRIWFRSAIGPLTTLAGKHEATLDLLLERSRLVHKALDHHKAGEYEASTMLVLSQVDGLTFDFTENKFGFFYRGDDSDFEDDETVAGMPEFLRTVRHAVNRRDNTTSLSTAFRRHPVMHGRYVAFGTETNSTKAFALLAGLLEWLKPRAAVLTDQWQAAHEAKYAGSMERDSEGKRLDQRGFIETRDSLRWLAIRETNEHRNHGRYNSDLNGMFPREGIGGMKRRDGTTLTVAPDGQLWWAWCPSDTSLVFGIAARGGAVTSYYYADDEPPGPLGHDKRWVHELDERPPDWVGE
jgi:hypothetical protein